jgi:ribosomal protein L40E
MLQISMAGVHACVCTSCLLTNVAGANKTRKCPYTELVSPAWNELTILWFSIHSVAVTSQRHDHRFGKSRSLHLAPDVLSGDLLVCKSRNGFSTRTQPERHSTLEINQIAIDQHELCTQIFGTWFFRPCYFGVHATYGAKVYVWQSKRGAT